jgi:hypothetical protein
VSRPHKIFNFTTSYHVRRSLYQEFKALRILNSKYLVYSELSHLSCLLLADSLHLAGLHYHFTIAQKVFSPHGELPASLCLFPCLTKHTCVHFLVHFWYHRRRNVKIKELAGVPLLFITVSNQHSNF